MSQIIKCVNGAVSSTTGSFYLGSEGEGADVAMPALEIRVDGSWIICGNKSK